MKVQCPKRDCLILDCPHYKKHELSRYCTLLESGARHGSGIELCPDCLPISLVYQSEPGGDLKVDGSAPVGIGCLLEGVVQ